LSTVRLSSSLLRIAFWNTPIERASAPISSLRSLNGMAIVPSPGDSLGNTRDIDDRLDHTARDDCSTGECDRDAGEYAQ
jgi:hypothetical protein